MTVQRIERVFFALTCHILFRHVGSPLVVDNNNYGSQREREFLVLVFFEFLVSRREMEDEKREIVVNKFNCKKSKK